MFPLETRDPYSPDSPFPGKFQILSLDGGGLKGVYSAAVLAAFEDDEQVSIADHFDLIAGTSTGGIIALALASGLSAKKIVEFYERYGLVIFPRLRFGWWNRFFSHGYKQEPLKDALVETFGEHKTIADLKKRVVIPSFNLEEGAVYIFKTPHHSRFKRDGKAPLWQVALATSAAPTYFPASTHLEGLRLIDGGVWANNPSLVAVLEAKSVLGASLENIYVLSLGTTKDLVNRPLDLDTGGLKQWAEPAADVIMQAQSTAVNNHLLHLLPRENTTRLDMLVPEGIFKLDQIDYARLKAKARHTSRHDCPKIQPFLTHRPTPYRPFKKGDTHVSY